MVRKFVNRYLILCYLISFLFVNSIALYIRETITTNYDKEN